MQTMQLDGLFTSTELAKTASNLLIASQTKNCTSDINSIPWPNFSRLHYPKLSTNKLISNYNNNNQSSSFMSMSSSTNTPISNKSTPLPNINFFADFQKSQLQEQQHLLNFKKSQKQNQPSSPSPSRLPTSLMLMDKLYIPVTVNKPAPVSLPQNVSQKKYTGYIMIKM